MGVNRDENGIWSADSNNENCVPIYLESFVRYLNIYDPIFLAAKKKSEFYFLATLFGIRSLQDAGWSPFETTVRALTSVSKLHRTITGEVQRHLELWLYGHIAEASEPYELVGNLLGVAAGEPFMTERFPPHIGKNGKPRELSPGEKAAEIERLGKLVNLPDAAVPMREMRDRELRNAIFHSDYAIHGPEVRIRDPLKIYTHAQITLISNRALAYLEALSSLKTAHLNSYIEPKIIETPTDMGHSRTVVLVAEGQGAVGLQAALSKKDVANGHILWRMALLTPLQQAAIAQDHTKWLLPANPPAPIVHE